MTRRSLTIAGALAAAALATLLVIITVFAPEPVDRLAAADGPSAAPARAAATTPAAPVAPTPGSDDAPRQVAPRTDADVDRGAGSGGSSDADAAAPAPDAADADQVRAEREAEAEALGRRASDRAADAPAAGGTVSDAELDELQQERDDAISDMVDQLEAQGLTTTP